MAEQRIYIAGKITGLPRAVYQHNFEVAEDRLKRKDYVVVNPVKMIAGIGETVFTYDEIMRVCLAALKTCDAIYLTKGWEDSRGAKIEKAEALNHGLIILEE
ncbi:DUF4406 domain-containing protein [Pseudoramibacter alactolyticus]|uniref:DUF4406 domain-containing protein n=1 Tax=Pseudoramibacter alactolyticus TaxID=113287 RepID=UPI0023542D2F|nr:DUF4406 domain-containing protein [Pseudoramibacter alactolyticus]MBM6968667.1 DUF4406 domain-containing protein [Pseudoramibacter alactolyticus]